MPEITDSFLTLSPHNTNRLHTSRIPHSILPVLVLRNIQNRATSRPVQATESSVFLSSKECLYFYNQTAHIEEKRMLGLEPTYGRTTHLSTSLTLDVIIPYFTVKVNSFFEKLIFLWFFFYYHHKIFFCFKSIIFNRGIFLLKIRFKSFSSIFCYNKRSCRTI